MDDQARIEDIPRLVKELREAAGRTQGQFADELSEYGRPVNRSTVNRIEKGHIRLGRELASALDAYAESRKLRDHDFLSMVTQLKARSADGKRGTHLSLVLSADDLTDIYVVMCDESEFSFHVRSGLAAITRLGKSLPAIQRRISLVVPSRSRVRDLFGTPVATERDERAGLYGGYADRLWRHMLTQVQRFRRIAQQSEGVALEVFESDAVLNSVVLAKSSTESKCVYWPCTPLSGKQQAPDVIPVVAGSDIAAWCESQITSMIDGGHGAARRQHLGDTFVIAGARDPGEPGEDPRRVLAREVAFNRFLPLAKVEMYDMDSSEGLAVASVLAVVRALRRGELTAEVLLKRRSQLLSGVGGDVDGKLALLSSRVTVSAMWDAVCTAARSGTTDGDADGSLPLSIEDLDVSKHIDDQSATVHHALAALRRHQPAKAGHECETAILDGAYRNAAVNELTLTYGLDGDGSSWAARLAPGGLDDCWIAKSEDGAIVPRLFTLILSPEERDDLERLARQNDGDELKRFAVDDLIEIIDHGYQPDRWLFDDYIMCLLTDARLRGQFRNLLVRLKEAVTSPPAG